MMNIRKIERGLVMKKRACFIVTVLFLMVVLVLAVSSCSEDGAGESLGLEMQKVAGTDSAVGYVVVGRGSCLDNLILGKEVAECYRRNLGQRQYQFVTSDGYLARSVCQIETVVDTTRKRQNAAY